MTAHLIETYHLWIGEPPLGPDEDKILYKPGFEQRVATAQDLGALVDKIEALHREGATPIIVIFEARYRVPPENDLKHRKGK